MQRAAIVAALLLTTAGCGQSVAPVAVAASAVTAVAAYRYADELAAVDGAVAQARAAIEQGPVVWTQWETLANAQLAAAQLSGDYAGYSRAEQSLAKAFALARNGGPYFSRARFNFTVHRLDRVEADLARAERETNPDPTAILALRADLAFYRGHYDQALVGYRSALDRREDQSNLVRLALWHARMGHSSEAAALLDRADVIYHGDSPHPRAWLALQRGLLELDRGRWDEALAHYQHALRLLPGWWQAAEHVAEIHALKGDTDTALREYTAVIAETNNPEYMDAIAKLLRARGDEPGAQQWIARARKLYNERLATLPEATYGHGLDHFLLFAAPTEALMLARQNYALRPNGDSQIQLADALLHAGAKSEAKRLMRSALASGWNTAKLHAAAARVFASNGQALEADQQRALALALNPSTEQQYGLPTSSVVRVDIP